MAKREVEQVVLTASPKVMEILKELIKKGGKSLLKADIPNLADYSTKFEDIR